MNHKTDKEQKNEKWLRNKNTIEFLGIWESIYNSDFNSPEFEGIKNQAGLNRFVKPVETVLGFFTTTRSREPCALSKTKSGEKEDEKLKHEAGSRNKKKKRADEEEKK